MSRVKLAGVLVLSIALVLAVVGVPRLAQAHARPGARPVRGAASTSLGAGCSPWRVVTSPNPSNVTNYLYGVAALSNSNVWAVGSQTNANGTSYTNNSLVEHWDGSAWSAVSDPEVGTAFNDLYGVAAISSSDIWAVGDYWDQAINDGQTLAEHWNGNSWQAVPTPDATQFDNQLYSVAAVSSNDVWAVGQYSNHSGALLEHWNGSSWSLVPIPNDGAQGTLNAVVAIAADDVWAVGVYPPTSGPSTLAEHWDGTSWQLVPGPNLNGSGGELTSVAAISANDVWAVGSYDSSSGVNASLAEHWDGTSWSVAPTPDTMGGDVLSTVTGLSSSNVWAGGELFNPVTGANSGYFEHWDGQAWTAVSSPNILATDFNISAMVATSTTDVWAVGSQMNSLTQTLVEHYTTLRPVILCQM